MKRRVHLAQSNPPMISPEDSFAGVVNIAVIYAEYAARLEDTDRPMPQSGLLTEGVRHQESGSLF